MPQGLQQRQQRVLELQPRDASVSQQRAQGRGPVRSELAHPAQQVARLACEAGRLERGNRLLIKVPEMFPGTVDPPAALGTRRGDAHRHGGLVHASFFPLPTVR
jgi:hypothetical protein